ncbi:threonine/serine ThrE exporter family protein [Gemella cuniculi]|uniref:threonine/serine ThrE exporter family protein n=1 Tax=Gemella cuniculi TaxID=150240 RepID=UPI000425F882|nr:threonine/serine exporter family protein [Gemella cuniculi]
MLQTLQNDQDAKKLLNFSVKMARSMLAYGAEVYRVEDTINRIYKSFDNIKAANSLVTYNFVIVSFIYDDTNYTTMRRVVLGEKNLEKISLINDLSRKMVMGGCSLEYAFKRLKEIKNKERYSNWVAIPSLVMSAPFFAIMFGGTFRDSIYAFIVMAVQATFLIIANKYKIIYFLSNFLGAFIATVLVMTLAKFFIIQNPVSIIIVSLMPLVPGVQITNSVRDFMAGDYLSGIIGVQAAVFVSTAIALGVVLGLKIV